MKSKLAIVSGLLAASAAALFAAPAVAGGNVHWSVSVGTPVYPVAPVVTPVAPPVVYAPPPVIYSPPPRVVYAPPPPTYYRPGIGVVQYGPGYYVPPPRHGWRHGYNHGHGYGHGHGHGHRRWN